MDVDYFGLLGIIGRVVLEYEIEICWEDGLLLELGDWGVLFICGVCGVFLFKEYYWNDEVNVKVFDGNGWFDIGDFVCIGEMGDLFFSDWDKDMLKVGVENVVVLEIEFVIVFMGFVEECVVVG